MDINAGLELYHASENAVLVDLRDEEDYRKGHIPGAVHALLGNIRQEIRKIATFRTPVFLYCYVGSRCTQAEALLKAKGYENALGIGGLDQYSGELEASEPMESPVPESAEDERIKKTDLVRELRVSRGLSQADFCRQDRDQPGDGFSAGKRPDGCKPQNCGCDPGGFRGGYSRAGKKEERQTRKGRYTGNRSGKQSEQNPERAESQKNGCTLAGSTGRPGIPDRG